MFRHAMRRAAGAAGGGGVEYGFVDFTTFTTNTEWTQIFDIAIPSGAQQGDLLVITVSCDAATGSTAGDISTEASLIGLSLYPRYVINSTLVLFVLYKTIGASESSPLTISLGDGLDSDEGGQNLVAHAMLFRGVTLNTTGTPLITSVLTGTTPTYNATTATNAVDDIVLTAASLDDDINISVTSPSSGYTVIGLNQSSTNGGTSGFASTLLTQYKVLTSTATETPGSPTLSGFNDQYATLTLQLQGV